MFISCILKGIGQQYEYFFKVYKIKSVLSLHAPVFLKIFGILLKKNLKKDFDCFYETLKQVLKAARELFPGLLYLSLVGFLHVITCRWTGEKSA